jgi:hypothetical protein
MRLLLNRQGNGQGMGQINSSSNLNVTVHNTATNASSIKSKGASN